MTIDIISQICVYCDYPLWRKMVQDNRSEFNKVILYPSKQHGVVDLENFWLNVFPETWVKREPIDYGTHDWRQAETEPLVAISDSDWIWFMEADFFVTDWPKFIKDLKAAMEYSDMIGCWNRTNFPYVHPSCLLIKRELLDKTNKDYSAHPEINGADHFAMLTRDAERFGAKITTLEELGYKEWVDYMHLGGITYPFQDWKGDGTDHFGVKRPDAYYVYLHRSRFADVPQSPEYIKQSSEIEEVLQKKYPELNLEDNEWNKFFQI